MKYVHSKIKQKPRSSMDLAIAKNKCNSVERICRKIFEEIIAHYFPTWMKTVNLHIQAHQ